MYIVKNMQTGEQEFTGTIEACTDFVANYGLGWPFLNIQDQTPIKPLSVTVKIVNHEYKEPHFISTKLPDYQPMQTHQDRRRND